MVQMVKILIPTVKERRNILHRCMESCGDNAGIQHQIIVYENNVGYVLAIKEMLYRCHDDDLVVLMNDDVEFGKDWLRILRDTFLFSNAKIAQPQEMNNPKKEDKAVSPMGVCGLV
jgi:GT2 family glycosyltransferase